MNLFSRFAASKSKHRVLVATASAICIVMQSAPAAAGSSYGGVITSITTNTDLGTVTIVTNGVDNGRPACTTLHAWAIALNPANSQVYAQLLMAYATQSIVYMWGDSVCSVSANLETLVQLQVGGPAP